MHIQFLARAAGKTAAIFIYSILLLATSISAAVQDTANPSITADTSSLNTSTESSPTIEDTLHVDTVNAYTLERMVVTSSRRQRLLEASQSIAIIKPAEWAGTNKTIADVIAEQTGVQTRRYGGTGSFQSITIRGVQGNEILVLLDGIPLNSAMGGAVDLGAINPDRIGEIEVYKGITPGEFGGNSIGGVINLKSKSSLKAQAVSANMAIGAYGYQKYGIEANKSYSDIFGVFSSLTYVKSDNDWPFLDRNKTATTRNSADDKVSTVKNHHYHFFEARIHPLFNFHGGRKLSTGISYSTSEVGIPASEGYTNKTAKHGQELVAVTARLSQEKPTENSSITLTPEIGYVSWSDNMFGSSLDESLGTSFGGITTKPKSYVEFKSQLHVAHVSYVADILVNQNCGSQITVQGKHSEIVSILNGSSLLQGGNWPGNSQELSLAADINGTLPMGVFSFGVTSGGAVKLVRSATKGGINETLLMSVSPSDTIEYPWSLRGGVQCRVDRVFNIYANAARYSNLPGLRDKYGAKGAILPNPELKEETGTTVEVGARFSRERFFLESVMFRTETKNGIVLIPDKNFSKPANLGASLTTGIETSLWVQPFNFLRTDLRATYQKAVNHSQINNSYGRQLPNEPPLTLLGKISIGPFKGAELQYWLDYKSWYFRDYANSWRVPENENENALIFHNAQIAWKASKHLDFGCSVRNFNNVSSRIEDVIHSPESGYSWVLYPSNEWCVTAGYSF